jgi:hypothetical protein
MDYMCYFVWVGNLISNCKGATYLEGAEENI